MGIGTRGGRADGDWNEGGTSTHSFIFTLLLFFCSGDVGSNDGGGGGDAGGDDGGGGRGNDDDDDDNDDGTVKYLFAGYTVSLGGLALRVVSE